MSSTQNKPFDVFISYRQTEPDKAWVRKTLVPALEENGVKVFVDFKHFRLGTPVVKEMERGVISSRYTLAVLTPAYLNSTFTEFENLIAEHAGLVSNQVQLIAVMLEHCQPRIGMQSKLWLDLSTKEMFENNISLLINTLREL